MNKTFTKFGALALLIVTGLGLFAAGPMKDIELDPDKAPNVGNQMLVYPTLATRNDEVKIDFFFEQDGMVNVRVMDQTGRDAAAPSGGYLKAGRTNEVIQAGSELSAGLYYIQVSHENGATLTQKIMITN